ncbi:MAG: hypothetical protein ACYCWW_06355, partial [Deltaproteobacteria bacterium]
VSGSCTLTLTNERLVYNALELIRSLGIKASISSSPSALTEPDPDHPGRRRRRVIGTRWSIHFKTSLPVFRLQRKLARLSLEMRETTRWLYITKIEKAHPQTMRCLRVAHPSHLALVEGFIPTHNSSIAQGILYGAASKQVELYVVDPVKGAADYVFLRDYTRAFATTPLEAAAVMKAVSTEVAHRKLLNAEHGVGSFLELPEDVRPRPIFLMIDEFTSLIGQDSVPKQPFDDPEEEAERQLLIAINQAKMQVGVYAGRIAREARSSGVTLLLGTQRLSAKMLENVPGASDLRTNLARVLLGKASWGDRAAALRSPDDAPVLDEDVPRGRGLWEPLSSAAVVVQSWYATQDQYRTELETRVPKLEPSDRLDLNPWMPKIEADPFTVGSFRVGPPARQPTIDEDVVVDLGEIELSLDDIEADELDVSEQDVPGHVDDRAAVVVEPSELDGAEPAPVIGPELDWNELEFVDAVGVGRREEVDAPAGAELVDDDPRWAIDWGEKTSGSGSSGRAGPVSSVLGGDAGSTDRAGPADRSPGPTLEPEPASDEWGIVPEVRRRQVDASAGAPPPEATDGTRPVVEDEF